MEDYARLNFFSVAPLRLVRGTKNSSDQKYKIKHNVKSKTYYFSYKKLNFDLISFIMHPVIVTLYFYSPAQ